MSVCGDIKEITFNHPTLGSGTFKPIAGEDSTFDLGGRKTLDEGTITSDGEKVDKINMMPWMVETTVRWSASQGLDLERLTALSGNPEQSDWTFELMDETIYGGKGKIVGDIQGSGQNGTIGIKITGGGGLRQI